MKNHHATTSLTLTAHALLAEQLSTVIQGISRAYAAIQENATGFPDEPFYYGFYRFGRPLVERLNPSGYLPLGITQAETGHSIKIGFGPSWGLQIADGDCELTLPHSRAIAAAVLVGAALTVGLGGYNQFLEMQKKRLEIEILR